MSKVNLFALIAGIAVAVEALFILVKAIFKKTTQKYLEKKKREVK